MPSISFNPTAVHAAMYALWEPGFVAGSLTGVDDGLGSDVVSGAVAVGDVGAAAVVVVAVVATTSGAAAMVGADEGGTESFDEEYRDACG